MKERRSDVLLIPFSRSFTLFSFEVEYGWSLRRGLVREKKVASDSAMMSNVV